MKHTKPMLDIRLNIFSKTFRLVFGVDSLNTDKRSNKSDKKNEKMSRAQTFSELSAIEESLKNLDSINEREQNNDVKIEHSSRKIENDNASRNSTYSETPIRPTEGSRVLNKADIIENESNGGIQIAVTDDEVSIDSINQNDEDEAIKI